LASAAFRGKEFLVAVLQNNDEAVRPNLLLHLTAYADTTQVTLSSSDRSFHDTVILRKDQTSSVPIPSTLELVSKRISQKSLSVTSTKDINVVVTSYKSYSVGAAAVLPVDLLGTEYYVVTPNDAAKEGLKEFAVVAGKQPSSISIEVKGRLHFQGRIYSSGSTFSIPLSPYQSLQLQSEDDLSGTKVTSDNVVAVFSGHTCAKVRSGCDFVVEQLLPVSMWGRAYVVPPNPMQKVHDLVYVVAAEATSISYDRGSIASTKHMEAGEVQVFKMNPNSPFYVNSLAAIQVVFFFTGSKRYFTGQDPFLLAIPPVSSYCTSYRFAGLNAYNYVLLIARNSDTNSIVRDQQRVTNGEWKEIPGTEFSWSMFSLNKLGSTWSTELERATFGLLGFGFQNYVGYGFAGLCATPSSMLFCSDISCKEQERCEMVEGEPTCIQETFSTCWVVGGPHYKTFDGKTFDFTGTCTYTLSKTCDPTASLPFFSIDVKNSHRGSAKSPYIDAVTIQVYNTTIVVVNSEDGFVRVNNHRTRLPISLVQGKLLLQQKGRFAMIKTNFMLKVLYDWDSHLMVKIPSAHSGKVCGMCGNSNGNPQDDALLPDGTLAQSAVDLGQFWKVLGDHRICVDSCGSKCKRCSRTEMANYSAEAFCWLLTQRQGPFRRCHDVVHPGIYVKNCISDLCTYEGLHAALCRALSAYASNCQEEGIVVDDWRTLAHCSPSCPANSNHVACGTACPATCNDAAIPSNCNTSSCTEGCGCEEGFVLDAGRCVPETECGCVFGDGLYGPGEGFWADDNCTERCVCEGERRKAINDRSVYLPYSHAGKILIYRGGRDVVIETDFGLTVTYDWHGNVRVSVPSAYEDALCGLCGNYNGDTRDELMLKNGRVTSDPNALGQSWKVADVPGCVELSRRECPDSMTTAEQEKLCRIISRADGPLRACHATVDPSEYVQNCKHDLCLHPEREEVLCQHVAHYVGLCQAAGVTIEEWRTGGFCKFSCPANSHYELCSQDCHQTCSNIYAPLRCTERCREGCVCDEGFVFSGDECVPVALCGCFHHGFYSKAGETFHPSKREECECQAGGVVVCQEIPPHNESCQMVNGELRCSPSALGTCVVTGDRSYLSYDGTAFEVQGSCSYILTESCSNDDDVRHFVVKMKKDPRRKKKVSGIEMLSVEVYGLSLTLERGKTGVV
ncbi:UNVERIFIED_CONTAM: hypothetical protein H355_001677, partial [Colinus virginianus]